VRRSRDPAGQWQGIQRFLDDIGLGRHGYAAILEDHGIDSLAAVSSLDPSRMRKLGISHQHAQRLRMGIAELRAFAAMPPVMPGRAAGDSSAAAPTERGGVAPINSTGRRPPTTKPRAAPAAPAALDNSKRCSASAAAASAAAGRKQSSALPASRDAGDPRSGALARSDVRANPSPQPRSSSLQRPSIRRIEHGRAAAVRASSAMRSGVRR
jgi:hypothetical protein